MSAAVALPWQQFICRVCGLIYDERLGDADSGLAAGTRWDDIPDDWACPICGVGKADFEPYVAAQASAGRRAPVPLRPLAAGNRAEAGVVVVGAGRAGWAVAQALREQGYTGQLTLLSACAGDVYDKPQLSVAVARGLDPNALVRESAVAAAARLGVRLRCQTHAVAIDAPNRRLRTTRGTLRWNHLVLAQGAEPAMLAVLPPALVWRINDLATYQRLRAALAHRPQRVAIIGAGLVGCELANDLALASHSIVLMDRQALPLAAQVPALASQRLLKAWAPLPIQFRGSVQVAGIERCEAAPEGTSTLKLNLKDGDSVRCDHVIAATGLRTAGRLAASAGLHWAAAAGGITVSADAGATSVPGIHALGDCVVVDGQASRYIEPISRQAQAIAQHILRGRGSSPEPLAVKAGGAEDSVQATVKAAANALPALRVKTSSLPITVRGWPTPDGGWHIELDTPEELHLVQRDAQGAERARLRAQRPGH